MGEAEEAEEVEEVEVAMEEAEEAEAKVVLGQAVLEVDTPERYSAYPIHYGEQLVV